MNVWQALAPGAFLALILGTFHGALGHLLFGRHWTRLPLFVLAGIVGCGLAWAFNVQFVRQLPAPGGLPLLEASVLAWLLLLVIAVLRRK